MAEQTKKEPNLINRKSKELVLYVTVTAGTDTKHDWFHTINLWERIPQVIFD